MSTITVLPGPFEDVTKQRLLARGLALSSVRRGSHVRTEADRPVVVVRNVVALRPSVIEAVFEFANRPQ